MVDLSTTNLLLGILAVVSIVEALALTAAGILGYRVYNHAMTTIRELDARRVAPLVTRVEEILRDVKGVTARVNEQTERVDQALKDTIDRVDETAERVTSSVRSKASRAIGIVVGIRSAIETFLGERPPAGAAGRVC